MFRKMGNTLVKCAMCIIKKQFVAIRRVIFGKLIIIVGYKNNKTKNSCLVNERKYCSGCMEHFIDLVSIN